MLECGDDADQPLLSEAILRDLRLLLAIYILKEGLFFC